MAVKRERLRIFLTENRMLKLLALATATASIYGIQRITSQMDEFEVPIVVQKEKGVAVLRQDARTAVITCRGSRDDLKRLEPSQIRVVLAPRGTVSVGTEQVPVGPRNVNGPLRGVSVIKVRPGIVNLTFDREIERKVSIARPELAGRPLLGRAEVDYEPKLATVRGPQQQLKDLKILRTGPVDVDGAVDSFARTLRILTDAEAGVWEVHPAEIRAQVNIVTEAISREWKALPVLTLVGGGMDWVMTLSPPDVDVSVLGGPQAVNRIQSEDIRVFVDGTAIREPGVYTLPASVHLKDGIDVSRAVNPPMIKLQVHERKAPVDREPEPAPVAVTPSGNPQPR